MKTFPRIDTTPSYVYYSWDIEEHLKQMQVIRRNIYRCNRQIYICVLKDVWERSTRATKKIIILRTWSTTSWIYNIESFSAVMDSAISELYYFYFNSITHSYWIHYVLVDLVGLRGRNLFKWGRNVVNLI